MVKEFNMSLREQISSDLKDAMRAKDKARLGTLRLMQTEIKKADIEARTLGKGEQIDDAAILPLLQKMVKQRQDTAAVFAENDRPERAEAELAEIPHIQAYLPQMKSEAETKALIEAKITALKASSMADMGKVVGALKGEHPGELDMALVAKLAKAALS